MSSACTAITLPKSRRTLQTSTRGTQPPLLCLKRAARSTLSASSHHQSPAARATGREWIARALMQQYPDAKVILTVRDSPEVWHRSQLNTVHKCSTQKHSWWAEALMQLALPWRKKQAAADRKWWSPWLYTIRFPDPAFAKQLYEGHIAEVCAAVPPEKLLIFNVKEGWQPLCAFLGLPVPDKPFPCTNTTEEMEQMMQRIHARLEATVAVAAAGLVLLTAATVADAAVMIRRRQS